MNIEERIKYTKDGFSYIEVSPIENIKWGGYCVCNGCNNSVLNRDMYLVFILNDTYCERCFNEWNNRETSLTPEEIEEDLKYQNKYHIEWYKWHLDRNENYNENNTTN